MRYNKRADWMARAPKSRRAMAPTNVTHFILHHAAGTYPSGAAAMQRIQRLHQDDRGWADYAYNWGVWEDGSIWEGRGWGAQGGHTRGWNTKAVAVCYMGDGRRDVPEVALRALLTVADAADEHFGRKLTRVAHRDVGKTECPGDFLYGWWNGGQPVMPEPAVVECKPSPVPNVRDGWVRHLKRMRRLR